MHKNRQPHTPVGGLPGAVRDSSRSLWDNDMSSRSLTSDFQSGSAMLAQSSSALPLQSPHILFDESVTTPRGPTTPTTPKASLYSYSSVSRPRASSFGARQMISPPAQSTISSVSLSEGREHSIVPSGDNVSESPLVEPKDDDAVEYEDAVHAEHQGHVAMIITVLLIGACAFSIWYISSLSTATNSVYYSLIYKLEVIGTHESNSKLLQHYAASYVISGEYVYYQQYFQLLHDDAQQSLLSALRVLNDVEGVVVHDLLNSESNVGIDVKTLGHLAQGIEIEEHERVIERACMALTAQCMNVDPALVPSLSNFEWSEDENRDYYTVMTLYNQTHWLSNSVTDRGHDIDTMASVARAMILGPYYDYLRDQHESQFHMMSEDMTTSAFQEIYQLGALITYAKIFTMVLSLLYIISGTATAHLMSKRRIVLLRLYKKRIFEDFRETDQASYISLGKLTPVIRICIIVVFIVGLSTIFVQFIAMDLSKRQSAHYSDWRDFTSLMTDTKSINMDVTRYAQSTSVTCNLPEYREYFNNIEHRNDVSGWSYISPHVAELVHAHSLFTTKLRHIESVAMSMAVRDCNIGSEYVSELYDYRWNYTSESDMSREGHDWASRNVSYSSTDYDMSLTTDDRYTLRLSTVTDARYRYYLKKVSQSISDIETAVDTLMGDDASDRSQNMNDVMMYLSLLLGALVVVLLGCGSYALIMLHHAEAPFSKKRADMTLIKQDVKLKSMEVTTSSFMWGYFIAIFLALTFSVAAIALLLGLSDQTRVLVMKHKQSIWVELITLYSTLVVNEPHGRDEYMSRLSNAYDTFNSISDWIIREIPESIQSNGGVEQVLKSMAYDVYMLLQQFDGHSDSNFRSLLQKFHIIHRHLLDSDDAVLGDLIDDIIVSKNTVVLVFVMVLVMLLFVIYFNGITSLNSISRENERTAIMLLMIPQDVLVTVPEIRGFMERHSEQSDRFIELEQTQLEQMRKDMERLQEQNRLQNQLVNSMLPEHIAAQIAHGKKVKPERYDQITVLLADIVGFTTLSAQLDAIKVMHMLNKLFLRFDKLTTEHGLFKVETIGDAYMVVGGIPKQVPDHAQRVGSMALDMIESLADFALRMPDGSRQPIRIRIGINTGPVVASVVGDVKSKPRYVLFGETESLVHAIESTSQPMRIHITESTAELLRIEYALEDRGIIDVKGRMMHTYFLVGRRTRSQSSASLLPSIRKMEETEYDELD